MVCVVLGAGEIMAAKIIFVNQNDKAQSFKVNLFGPEKNRVKVANVLAVFKSSVAIMGDGSIMEADDDGLSMDTFVAGGTYNLSLVPQEVQPLSGTPEESPVMMPSLPNWGTNTGDVRSVENLNTNTPKEKTFPKGLKRDFRGIPIMGSDQGGLETVEPSSSHVENIQESQQIVEHQPHEVGDLVGFLQGSSGQGLQLSKDDGGSAGEGESDDDAAGSTPCIDNGKASRGHTRCVKCGHSKNPSAKLQCTHCGAYLRDQTKARVAQRWAMLKEKAKREGRLGDKVQEIQKSST
ncbi:hypothetical protein M758_10G108400 [Ceratodon purpureus]|uniref:Uncharacterized protein n=1 Tax=Ceratodon purpureus TaxID=3225 RepID=A0A8T0GJ29_CERPU|nr:hypothetical protein KC19_10G112000 [Ceratodon purpureus]KAG0603623.1 hypothetical protein M758_10G108400 [Ceratodon purpureus]